MEKRQSNVRIVNTQICLRICQANQFFLFTFLARLDEVQEELLYYRPRRQNVKVFTLKFFM